MLLYYTADPSYVDKPVHVGPGQIAEFQRCYCVDESSSTGFGFCNLDPNKKEHVTNWMSYSSDKGVVDEDLDGLPWTRRQRAATLTNFFYCRKGVQEDYLCEWRADVWRWRGDGQDQKEEER